MEYVERVTGFCKKQKSVTTMLEKFIECFMEEYVEEEPEEQVILAQCVQQLFRKYYYSALDPEMILTPAKIVNTLCEREFGNELMTVPVLHCTIKGKKLARIEYRFASCGADHHPMVDDLTSFLEIAGAGIRMEAPGIPLTAEYSKFKKQSLLVFDRHYINFLGLIAQEAGYIDSSMNGDVLIGYTTDKAQEYLRLDSTVKLQKLLELGVFLCSRMLTRAFPYLKKEFAVLRVAGFLRNPKSFDKVMESIYKKMGLDLKRLDRSMLTGSFEMTLQALSSNEDNLIKLFEIQRMLDIYFFTPFSYYLHVIQPVYPDIYDLAKELDELLIDLDNFQAIRNKLFSIAIDFDLTVLGEHFLGMGQKPRRKRRVPDEMGDVEFLDVVLDSTAYMEAEYEAFGLNVAKEEYMQFLMKGKNAPSPRTAGKKAQIIDFPLKKAAETETAANQIFIFKVKYYDAKRIWRQIEIRGSQSLRDLHRAIVNAFNFDEEHLYAFFLSNRFWDSDTEYAHPHAECRSADTALIGRLGLALRQKIAYIFDFGDEHRFEVELIAVQAADSQVQYPRESKHSKLAETYLHEYKLD